MLTTVRIEITAKMLFKMLVENDSHSHVGDKHLNDHNPHSDISCSMSENVIHTRMSCTIIAMFNSRRYMTLYALKVSTSVLFANA